MSFNSRPLLEPGSATLALALLLPLLGCLGPPPPGPDAQRIVYDFTQDPLVNPESSFEPYPALEPDLVARNETLIVHSLSEPESLNPLFATNGSTLTVTGMIFEPLLARTANQTFFWNEHLVERTDGDEREIRVTLKKDLRWHDGTRLDAHDVEFTWRAIVDPKVPAVQWKSRAEKISDVRALDDLTVLFVHGERALAPQLRLAAMAFPVLPRHLLGDPEERRQDPSMRSSPYFNRFARELVIGNGPYMFEAWRGSDQVSLRRAPGHPPCTGNQSFERVIHKLMPDRNLTLLEFLGGGLDVFYLTAQQAASQTGDEDFAARGRKVMVEQHTQAHLRWNVSGTNPFFADRRVRLAMAHSLDRERLIRDVTYNLHRPAVSFFDGTSEFANPDLTAYEFDLERASQLLEDAGWLPSDDDGWRYKEIDSKPVRFAFEVATFQAFRDFPLVANQWRSDLRRIGVEMQLRTYERGAFAALRSNGEFQVIADYAGGGGDPDNWSPELETGEGGRNYGGYSNPAVDQLFEQARYEQDREKRRDIYRQAHAAEHADPAFLPLWNFRVFLGTHKRIRGIEIGPNGPYGIAGKPPLGWPLEIGPGWWVRADEASGPAS